jgi:glucose-1-phosphate cytidylyltransferase
MKAVILAGGFGTRLSEHTGVKPKPMVEIGGLPILWHIMKIYSAYDINDFVICLGYKGHIIKEYFSKYPLLKSNMIFDFRNNSVEYQNNGTEPWRVSLIETGYGSMTGGRLKRVRSYIGNEPFCMTYGDGVSDVDIKALIGFHYQQNKLATLTAVKPPGRFGAFKLKEDQHQVPAFKEKPDGDGAWINGGFFVLEPDVFDLIDSDTTIWEREPLERLAASGNLSAYRHSGFWQPMDTLRDKNYLDDLWESGRAPWKVWP